MRTAVLIDMVGYSVMASSLEENVGPEAVQLLDLLRKSAA